MASRVPQTDLPLRDNGATWFRLGLARVAGLDVPADLIVAQAYFTLADRRGSMEGRLYRRGLDGRMSLADRAEAERLAREWGDSDQSPPVR